MDNPYASPASTPAMPSSSAVSPQVIGPLAETKPWARFLSILGFVGCGFMVIAALGMFAIGSRAGMSASYLVGMAIAYILFGLLYIYPSVKLFSYASRINRLMMSPSEQNLISALQAQKSFWKFVGIMTIITIVVYFLLFFFAFSAGAASSGGSYR